MFEKGTLLGATSSSVTARSVTPLPRFTRIVFVIHYARNTLFTWFLAAAAFGWHGASELTTLTARRIFGDIGLL